MLYRFYAFIQMKGTMAVASDFIQEINEQRNKWNIRSGRRRLMSLDKHVKNEKKNK